jgi:hypothetical protein
MIFIRMDRRDPENALRPRSHGWNSNGIATGTKAHGIDAKQPRPERDVSGGLASSAKSALVLDGFGLGVDRTHMWAPAAAGVDVVR